MADKIKFRCACGKKLNAPLEAAGKKALCTACGQKVRIPVIGESQAKAQAKPAAFLFETELETFGDLQAAKPNPATQVPVAWPPQNAPPASQSKPSVPPPPASAENRPSIWEEENEYQLLESPPVPCPRCGQWMSAQADLCLACGYQRHSATTTLAPAPKTPPLAKPARSGWFRRTSKQSGGRRTGSNAALRIGLVLLAIGAAVFMLGINEKRLADASSEDPETISLQNLIQRGADGNPNIVLTDFQLCRNFVYDRQTIVGQGVGSWTKVWVPIVPRPAGAEGLIPVEQAGKVRAIVLSTHVENEDQMMPRLNVPQLRGMVTNRIQSLNANERKILEGRYPGINADTCLIIDEGREPKSSALISLYLAGGSVVFLAGVVLLVKRFF